MFIFRLSRLKVEVLSLIRALFVKFFLLPIFPSIRLVLNPWKTLEHLSSTNILKEGTITWCFLLLAFVIGNLTICIGCLRLPSEPILNPYISVSITYIYFRFLDSDRVLRPILWDIKILFMHSLEFFCEYLKIDPIFTLFHWISR